MRRQKRRGGGLRGLLFLLLALVAGVGVYYNTLLNRLSFDRREEASALPEIVDESMATGEVRREKNVVNILLIGSDFRIPNSDDPGRADVTMLCSLNKKTGSVKLVSFERGIMVAVPGHGTDLLTHSFHWGGAELTTELLRQYFRLDIEGYAHVDFDSFSALVDAVGGVDITLTQAEAWALGMNEGENHMDGAQALNYCRLRSIDSNWQRIARQRTTIQAILDQVKDSSLPELDRLSREILPLIHTDLGKTEITSLLVSLPKFLGATAGQMTVPDHNDQHCDFQYEADRLNEFLYG